MRRRVLVMGAGGLLGHKVCQTLGPRFETTATLRSPTTPEPLATALAPLRTITAVRVEDAASVAGALDESGADVVVNCIGVVKQDARACDPVSAIRINALFPHELAEHCASRGARLIHISTDCVFSGRRGAYTEDDRPDAVDLYGRTKLLGEVDRTRCLTLRTSFIGRELRHARGLLEWFLGQAGGTVCGFRRAVFSGLTTSALAETIGVVIERHPDLAGVRHVSAEPIDKLALLCLVRDIFDLDVEIQRRDEPVVDRSLDSSRFRAETGWRPEAWPAMIQALAADTTPYDALRAL